MYLGLDTAGHRRFISSRNVGRRPNDGRPAWRLLLDGTGLYARAVSVHAPPLSSPTRLAPLAWGEELVRILRPGWQCRWLGARSGSAFTVWTTGSGRAGRERAVLHYGAVADVAAAGLVPVDKSHVVDIDLVERQVRRR
ncbi:MAG: hypothetical protein WKF40_05220 [Thermoleophilaceae bacterium]